jgi:hypothetical protein
MDGTTSALGGAGMSAPEARQEVSARPKIQLIEPEIRPKSAISNWEQSSEFELRSGSRCGQGFADLP